MLMNKKEMTHVLRVVVHKEGWGLVSQYKMTCNAFKLVYTFFYLKGTYLFKKLINLFCYLAGLKKYYLNMTNALREKGST